MEQDLVAFVKSSLSCTICLEIFTYPHTIQCGHTYCGNCLQRWLGQRVECPMCRTEISQEPIPNLILMEQIEKLMNKSTDTPVHRIDYGWRKYVKKVIRDEEDGVERCMFCHWEIIEDACRCSSILNSGNLSESDVETIHPPHPLSVIDALDYWDDDMDDIDDEAREMMCPSWCDCYECCGTDYSDTSQDLEYYGEDTL